MHESYFSPKTLYLVFENGKSHGHLASLIISFRICILSERLGNPWFEHGLTSSSIGSSTGEVQHKMLRVQGKHQWRKKMSLYILEVLWILSVKEKGDLSFTICKRKELKGTRFLVQ